MFTIAHADPNMFVAGLMFGFGLGIAFVAVKYGAKLFAKVIGK